MSQTGRMLSNTDPALRRAWHPVARSVEVTTVPRTTRLLGDDWVVVRLPDGVGGSTLAAFADRCPHRLAPLSAGWVDGAFLRCGSPSSRSPRSSPAGISPTPSSSRSSNARCRASTRNRCSTAKRLGVGFHLGYAELTPDGHRYNTAVLVERDGRVVARYRKVHLPGHEEPEPWRPFQHLERKYFEPGPESFAVHRAFGGLVGLAICNDRRWPETYRVLGLQGVELVCIGYNTPIHYAPDPAQDRLAGFHNGLVMAAGAYQNGTWVVGVAKGGIEEGVEGLADSQIIAPSGEVVARCETVGDEVVVAQCELDLCLDYKRTVFDFERYRRPEMYTRITAQRGVIEPEAREP